MPAAAVIPAPIAYIKVVAVKKLVVELRAPPMGRPLAVLRGGALPSGGLAALNRVARDPGLLL